jgi:hypothetical protein
LKKITDVGERVDSNLIELARSWLDKLLPYRRASFALLSTSECFGSLTFLHFLLSYGCIAIGVTKNMNVYLRCGNKLIKLSMFFTTSQCYEEVKKAVVKIPILSEDEEYKLVAGKPYGRIRFYGTVVDISVFGDKPAYLETLEGVPLYLEGVEIESSDLYKVVIDVATKSNRGALETIAEVRYALEEDKIKSRIYLQRKVLPSQLKEKLTMEELKKRLLAMLNEKYFIMNELLREIADPFIKGFKIIIITLLY